MVYDKYEFDLVIVNNLKGTILKRR